MIKLIGCDETQTIETSIVPKIGSRLKFGFVEYEVTDVIFVVIEDEIHVEVYYE